MCACIVLCLCVCICLVLCVCTHACCVYTVKVDLLVSQIFGELVSNRCWRHFNLAKSCSCYPYNSYETILALFKFGRQTKNRQTAKLKPLPKMRIRYIMCLYVCVSVCVCFVCKFFCVYAYIHIHILCGHIQY